MISSTTSLSDFQLADTDGGAYVDACGKQIPGVLPSPGVTRARHVAVGEIVY